MDRKKVLWDREARLELEAEREEIQGWGEIIDPKRGAELVAEGRLPVVFNFRPDTFLAVAPERLTDWEEYFAKKVGLRPNADGWTGDPRQTISGSPSGWDDCDYW